jgi:hypothetical protein
LLNGLATRRRASTTHRHVCGHGLHRPEITDNLPDYLSLSAGLKFANVPNGLAARRRSSTTSSPCLQSWVTLPGDHGQAAGLLVSVRWPGVRKCAERPGHQTEINHDCIAMLAVMSYIARRSRATCRTTCLYVLCVQPPVGFWDQAAKTNTCCEVIANGRLVMLAIIGMFSVCRRRLASGTRLRRPRSFARTSRTAAWP